MLGLLFGRRASTEERATVRRRCATRETAVKQCLAANDATACDAFGQDLDLCKVRLETHDRSSSRSAPPRALFPAARAPRARRSSSRVVRRSRPPPSIFPRAGPRGVPRRRRRIQPLHPPGHQPHRHESHHAGLRRCPSQASRLPSNQARLSVTASDEPRRIDAMRGGRGGARPGAGRPKGSLGVKRRRELEKTRGSPLSSNVPPTPPTPPPPATVPPTPPRTRRDSATTPPPPRRRHSPASTRSVRVSPSSAGLAISRRRSTFSARFASPSGRAPRRTSSSRRRWRTRRARATRPSPR